jgi:hypothetical protein
MRRNLRRLTQIFAVAALVAAWHGSASAQAQAPSPQGAQPAANLSDQKLDQTAAAMQNVVKVKQDYQQRLQSASESDRERITKEASDALKSAVTEQGLSVEEYSSILVVAQSDPEVQKKLLDRIQPKDK